LYQHFANDESSSPNVAIIINVQRQLDSEPAFGNPWILMPLPHYPDPSETARGTSSLVEGAVHIRHAINWP
jgi:hypothetical protein